MPTFKVNTDSHNPVELYYEGHGTGKPIVLIHGWPLSGRINKALLEFLAG